MNRFNRPIFFVLFFFIAFAARGQYGLAGKDSVESFSGQFVIGPTPLLSPLRHRPDFATNSNFVRLESALLAVSVERFKDSLLRQLDFPIGSSWRGKIFITLRPARSLDDDVTIGAVPFLDKWNYRLELPDLMTRNRFANALATVLLLEIANRNVPVNARSAEIPPWLADGLAQQTLATATGKLILSPPAKSANGPPQNQATVNERGFDSLSNARKILLNSPALIFDQLSWPSDAQIVGDDGGVYLASAQLFVADLLALPNGPAKIKNFLARLAGDYNWQTAFFAAFAENFSRPLDVEKWWALRVIDFATQTSSARWTQSFSVQKLDELLSVPVDYRSDSNALPVRAEISLQDAIGNLDAAQQSKIFRVKVRDLEVAQLRLARPFAELAAGYRKILADYLGNSTGISAAPNLHGARPMARKTSVRDTLKKLDVLDAQRRKDEASIKINRIAP